MADVIRNRYDFVVLFDVENGNPNGDPDAGNMPRVDPETGCGLVTDVCLKRKIRNYVETVKENDPRFGIYIKDGVPLNASDKTALESAGHKETDLKALKKSDPDIDKKLMQYMCGHYFDIRTFGAVMTTFVKNSLNCGQVRGPVQLTFARSVDPIIPQEITITRVAKTTEERAERAHVVERRAHEVANLLVKLRIILLELLYVFRIDAKRFERASIVHVENGAILHVDVETGIVLLHRFDVVAHFALQAYVRDDAVSGFRVDARHIASIRVTVGVAVLDIEVDNEIVTVLDRIAHGYASWIWSDSASRFSKRFWF